jgi:hypothetical protein
MAEFICAQSQYRNSKGLTILADIPAAIGTFIVSQTGYFAIE